MGRVVEGHSDGRLQTLQQDRCLPQRGALGKRLVLYLKHAYENGIPVESMAGLGWRGGTLPQEGLLLFLAYRSPCAPRLLLSMGCGSQVCEGLSSCPATRYAARRAACKGPDLGAD